jgi:universal stress protein A
MRIKAKPRSKSVVVEMERQEKELPAIPVPSLQLKKILLPVDFSGTSRKALSYAVSFAKQFNAEAILLHVIEPTAAAPQTETFSAITNSPTRREDCEEQLSQWRHEFRPGALTELREGSASREIVRAADERNVDLIIIGTQGRTGLARMFGSTAEWVVRHAPCPVLVVREREHDFVQPE